MPSPLVDVATGITIVFATSAFSAEVTDVTPPAASRESVDTSQQLTASSVKTCMPVDLAEWGELKFGIHFNPDTKPPALSISGVAETVTVTFPAAKTWIFTGFMTGYESSAPLNGKMTGTVTVKVTGAPAI